MKRKRASKTIRAHFCMPFIDAIAWAHKPAQVRSSAVDFYDFQIALYMSFLESFSLHWNWSFSLSLFLFSSLASSPFVRFGMELRIAIQIKVKSIQFLIVYHFSISYAGVCTSFSTIFPTNKWASPIVSFQSKSILNRKRRKVSKLQISFPLYQTKKT